MMAGHGYWMLKFRGWGRVWGGGKSGGWGKSVASYPPGTLPVYGPLKVRGFGFIDSGCHLLVNLLSERRPEAAA